MKRSDNDNAMIFAPIFHPKSDRFIEPVSGKTATERETSDDPPRESPPKWSTLQQIPSPKDRMALLNEYIQSQSTVRKERNLKERSVGRKYNESSRSEAVGQLLSAVV